MGSLAPSAQRETAMRRAFALAAHGPARGINPQVGCVILSPDGTVLAEGWHRGAGTPHAEVDALSQLAPGAASGATAVVTLEPCNHLGRTGPCAEALIEAGIARVVYSVSDPGQHSSGGAERLRSAGLAVDGGLLRAEGEALLGDWLRSARLGRPVVTIKWASSLDGRAAASDGSSQWITGEEARIDVHLRRSAADAIAVGTGTVVADDPSLTARAADGSLLSDQPLPVVFGRRAVSPDAALHRHPRSPLFFDGSDLPGHLAELHASGIRSLFVEGGPTLASAFVAAGLADEFLVYLAPMLLGGPKLALGDLGIASIDQAMRLEIQSLATLGDDVLIVASPRTSQTNDPHTQSAPAAKGH